MRRLVGARQAQRMNYHRDQRKQSSSSVGAFLAAFSSALLSAGAGLHEFENSRSQARIECPNKLQGWTADQYPCGYRHDQSRGVAVLVIHVSRFAAALGCENVPQRVEGKRGPLERHHPGEGKVLRKSELRFRSYAWLF